MSPQADDLLVFLGARFEEDHIRARAVPSCGEWREAGGVLVYRDEIGWGASEDEKYIATFLHGRDAVHAARWSPARVLRDVEAKRQLLDRHQPGRYGECVTCDPDSCGCMGGGSYPCDTARLLALPYAEHPDYREEWKP